MDIFERSKKPDKNGWSTGWYSCKCNHCKKEYTGHKRSYECSECAYDETIQRRSIYDLTQKEIDEINKQIDRLTERKSFLESKDQS